MRPDVGAVVVHEDGNIAGNTDRALRTIKPQGLPLFVKSKLQWGTNFEVGGKFLAYFFKSCRFAVRQLARPAIPAFQFVPLTERVEENKIVEPPGVLGTELIEAFADPPCGRGGEILRSLEQQGHFAGKDLVILDRARFRCQGTQLCGVDPTMLCEAFQAD